MSRRNPLLSVAALAARWLPMPLKQAFYRYPRLAGWIRRGLNRAAPAGLTVVEIAGGPLAGMRMRLDLHTEKDYWLGTYEPELMDAAAALIEPGWTVYDVGANLGYVSLRLAQCSGPAGRVYAFEALPANLERLNETVALNGMNGRVEVVPAAVADRDGPVSFLVAPSGGMGKAAGSAGRAGGYIETIEVTGISLDSFVHSGGNPPPQLIKLDIEGGEVLALPGMRRLLAEAHPILLIELHGPEAARLAWELLTGCGYRLCRMQPGYPPIETFEALDWKAYLAAF